MAGEKRSRVTLHVAKSLDGFIANDDESFSWLNSPADAYEGGVAEDAEEIERVLKSIDCYVLGARTYEHALKLGWPYGETAAIVVTKRDLPVTRDSVEFFSGELSQLVEDVLTPRYDNVWVVGGAMLCQSFLRQGLVDEIRLSIAPILLGAGLRLFDDPGIEQRLQLKEVVAYRNGFVELAYALPPEVT